jgi:hypothetical protein
MTTAYEEAVREATDYLAEADLHLARTGRLPSIPLPANLLRTLLAGPPEPSEPVAWIHALHNDLGQSPPRLSVTLDEGSPFGEPGRDYGADYRVTTQALGFIASPGPPEPSEEDRMAAEKAFRVWYFEHTGKRLFATNAIKAVDVVVQALYRSRRNG